MIRRVVQEAFEATREENGRTKRQFANGNVLNMLQWVRPGQARFTVEGEGCEVWVCDEPLVERATIP